MLNASEAVVCSFKCLSVGHAENVVCLNSARSAAVAGDWCAEFQTFLLFLIAIEVSYGLFFGLRMGIFLSLVLRCWSEGVLNSWGFYSKEAVDGSRRNWL